MLLILFKVEDVTSQKRIKGKVLLKHFLTKFPKIKKLIFFLKQTPEESRKADPWFYFQIVTNRTVLMRTNTEEDMILWMDAIRKYADLIRIEQSFGCTIYTPNGTRFFSRKRTLFFFSKKKSKKNKGRMYWLWVFV